MKTYQSKVNYSDFQKLSKFSKFHLLLPTLN